MRILNGHKVNPANDKLEIAVLDEPGAGGACHAYRIEGFNVGRNPSEDPHAPQHSVSLVFQNGPIAEAGVNGVTHEALLAILIDRLESFQKGKYACRENAIALTHLQDAQHWLQHRTRERMARNVEGTHTV